MIDHLIFDFDGTVSDSYPVFHRIIHNIAEDHGLKIPVDEAELDRLLKINTGMVYKTFGWETCFSREEYGREFRIWQDRFAYNFTAFPEAIALLEHALQKGKKLYIYTHSGDVVHKIMKNMGINSMFSYVLTANRGFPAKPAPDALQFLMKECSLQPQACMMIGDRPIDALAGMNAGMTGVLWDADNRYENVLVDHRVSSLLDICQLI